MIIEYPAFDKKVFLKSFFAKKCKPQVITSQQPNSKWPHYMITQLNSLITSEFAAMKCLTYIDFFCCHNLEQTDLSISETIFILVKSRKQALLSNWTAKVSFVRDTCHKSGQCNISQSKSPEKSVVEMNNKSFLTVLGRAALYYRTVRKWRPSRKEEDLLKGDHAKCSKSGKHLQGSTNARISNVKSENSQTNIRTFGKQMDQHIKRSWESMKTSKVWIHHELLWTALTQLLNKCFSCYDLQSWIALTS